MKKIERSDIELLSCKRERKYTGLRSRKKYLHFHWCTGSVFLHGWCLPILQVTQMLPSQRGLANQVYLEEDISPLDSVHLSHPLHTNNGICVCFICSCIYCLSPALAFSLIPEPRIGQHIQWHLSKEWTRKKVKSCDNKWRACLSFIILTVLKRHGRELCNLPKKMKEDRRISHLISTCGIIAAG